MHPKNPCKKVSSELSEFCGIKAKFVDKFPKECDFLIAKVSKLSLALCLQCLCVDANPRKMTNIALVKNTLEVVMIATPSVFRCKHQYFTPMVL